MGSEYVDLLAHVICFCNSKEEILIIINISYLVVAATIDVNYKRVFEIIKKKCFLIEGLIFLLNNFSVVGRKLRIS